MQTASPFSHGGQSKPGQQQGSSRKRSRMSHSGSAAAQLVDRAFSIGPAELSLVLPSDYLQPGALAAVHGPLPSWHAHAMMCHAVVSGGGLCLMPLSHRSHQQNRSCTRLNPTDVVVRCASCRRWDATPNIMMIVCAVQLALAASAFQAPNMSKLILSECTVAAVCA